MSFGLQVTWAVQALLKRQGWSELPLFALGGSSGGALVLLLALRMQLQVSHLLGSALLTVEQRGIIYGRIKKQLKASGQ